MSDGFKPMAFGEHLLQVIRMEEDGLSRDTILNEWGSVREDDEWPTRYQLACGDAGYWVLQAHTYGSDYLLECLNERYVREEILGAIDGIIPEFEVAKSDPLRYAFNKSSPTRLTLLAIALVDSLSPGEAVRKIKQTMSGSLRAQMTPLIFHDNLQRVFDLEEIAGIPKENISVLMDPRGWSLGNFENVDVPRVSNFDKACSEARAWVERFVPERELLAHLAVRYSNEEIVEASTAIERNAHCRGNPLVFALKLPFPLRLTIVMLAIHRWYDSGGENVDVSSDLPPKPPAPGHWGGRTPGYEEPLPPRNKDLDVGPKR